MLMEKEKSDKKQVLTASPSSLYAPHGAVGNTAVYPYSAPSGQQFPGSSGYVNPSPVYPYNGGSSYNQQPSYGGYSMLDTTRAENERLKREKQEQELELSRLRGNFSTKESELQRLSQEKQDSMNLSGDLQRKVSEIESQHRQTLEDLSRDRERLRLLERQSQEKDSYLETLTQRAEKEKVDLQQKLQAALYKAQQLETERYEGIKILKQLQDQVDLDKRDNRELQLKCQRAEEQLREFKSNAEDTMVKGKQALSRMTERLGAASSMFERYKHDLVSLLRSEGTLQSVITKVEDLGKGIHVNLN